MKDHSAMSPVMSAVEPVTGTDAPKARSGSVRDRILFALILYALVRSGEALAGDQASMAGAASRSEAASSREPRIFTTATSTSLFSLERSDTEAKTFSATEFRPRIHAQSNSDQSSSPEFGGSEKPLFEGRTVWQRLSEYRSQDRVRLLTLWQTRASTLSLQAGKHGGPSLQWSSPWMMHDSASRGLLDHLFSVPFRSAPNNSPNSFRGNLARPAEPAPIKQLNLTAGAP
jgi:hypothetical protein